MIKHIRMALLVMPLLALAQGGGQPNNWIEWKYGKPSTRVVTNAVSSLTHYELDVRVQTLEGKADDNYGPRITAVETSLGNSTSKWDLAYSWGPQSVVSVNGQTGAVVITAADIGVSTSPPTMIKNGATVISALDSGFLYPYFTGDGTQIFTNGIPGKWVFYTKDIVIADRADGLFLRPPAIFVFDNLPYPIPWNSAVYDGTNVTASVVGYPHIKAMFQYNYKSGVVPKHEFRFGFVDSVTDQQLSGTWFANSSDNSWGTNTVGGLFALYSGDSDVYFKYQTGASPSTDAYDMSTVKYPLADKIFVWEETALLRQDLKNYATTSYVNTAMSGITNELDPYAMRQYHYGDPMIEPSPTNWFTFTAVAGGYGVQSYKYGDFPDMTDVVVPYEFNGQPVVKMRENAFGGHDITSVIVPKSVRDVDRFAFGSCRVLLTANLPAVTNIAERAFTDCYELTNLVIGSAHKPVFGSLWNNELPGNCVITVTDPHATGWGTEQDGTPVVRPWFALPQKTATNLIMRLVASNEYIIAEEVYQ